MSGGKKRFDKPPRTVLVLRFSSAGDIVLTTPAIEALHKAWPETRIVWAVKGEYADLVRHNPNVAEVAETREGEGFFSYLSRLRGYRPEAILDLHGKMRSRLISFLLPRGSRRVEWKKRPWRDNLPVRMALRPYRAAMWISDRYHQAVETLVGEKLPRGEMRHYLGPEDQRLADEALALAGIASGAKILGMSPGSNWETKRWPIERFTEIARRARAQGMSIVITGSGAEAPLGEAVAREVPGTANLAGKLPLKALGGVLSRCAVFVANDSGPMHLARALGVPTLAFFGSTDPNQFEFAGHKVLFAGVPCSPCHFYGRRKCPEGHFRCMLDLGADQAWNELEPLIALGRRVPPVHA